MINFKNHQRFYILLLVILIALKVFNTIAFSWGEMIFVALILFAIIDLFNVWYGFMLFYERDMKSKISFSDIENDRQKLLSRIEALELKLEQIEREEIKFLDIEKRLEQKKILTSDDIDFLYKETNNKARREQITKINAMNSNKRNKDD